MAYHNSANFLAKIVSVFIVVFLIYFPYSKALGQTSFASSDINSEIERLKSQIDEGEALTIWDSRLKDKRNVKVFPSEGKGAIYQIVAKPVAFGEEVHGVVIWGSRIDRETLESIKEISSVDIALYSGERINASTLPPQKEKELSNLISFNMTDEEDAKGDSVSKEEIMARELDIIRVVGKTEPVRIYELVSRKGELDDSRMIVLEEFQVGVGLYRERKWDEACECFERILELDPSDKPSQEYMRRCKKYQNLPPPLDWGGVFELRGK